MHDRIVVRTMLLGLCVAAVACAGDGIEPIRHVTYPPDFNYVPPEKLQSTMWELAAEVRQLEYALAPAAQGETVSRDTVAAILLRMERSVSVLGPGQRPSNQPRVSHNVERLRDDLRRARRGVALEPPNYFWAGNVSGACRYCHAPAD